MLNQTNLTTGKQIVEKIRQGGFTFDEMQSNIDLQRFVTQILYEQKISAFVPNEQGFATHKKGEVDLLPQEAADLIYRLFSDVSTIMISPEVLAKANDGHIPIPGMTPKVERTVKENGVLSFDVQFPELDYIKKNVLDVNSPAYACMFDKVILPYIQMVSQSGEVPSSIPENIRSAMEEVFAVAEAEHSIEDFDRNAMMNYTMHNILKLSNPNDMLKCAQEVRTTANFEGIPFSEVLSKHIQSQLAKDQHTTKRLEGFLNGISGQVYMNSFDENDFTPEKLKERIQTAFEIYNAHDVGNPNLEMGDNRYRTCIVRIGNGPLGMFPNGDNIEQAMERFLMETAMTAASADRISEDEYLKRVASLHSRFILIHPFPESNGRIGRNMMNMLLSKVGRNFVLPKENKSNYLDLLNGMRTNIFTDLGRAKNKGRKSPSHSDAKQLYDSGYWAYMENLTERPDKFVPQEMRHASPLAEFIKASNTIPLDTTKENKKRKRWNLFKKRDDVDR